SMDPYSDSALLKEVIHGRKEIYSILVERYSPAVAAVAKNFTDDSAEIEGLVTEVFVEAYRELRKIGDFEHFFSFLLEMMRSKIEIRRRAEQKKPSGRTSNFLELEIPEDIELIRKKYFEGQSYQQMGRSLDLSPEEIEQKIRRSRCWAHFARN